MKWFVFLGAVLGTIAAFLASCFVVVTTLIWLVRQWDPAPWLVWAVGLGLMGATVASIWRWWRLPVERRFRFSLRGMLVGIMLFALWIGTAGVELGSFSRENQAIWAIQSAGGHVQGHQGLAGQRWTLPRWWFFRLTGLNHSWDAQTVYVMNDRVMEAVLQHRRELADLEVVQFRGVSPAGMALVGEFVRFPKLRYCGLDGPQTSDAHLESLAQWTNLLTIVLDGGPKITDAGLAHLVDLPRLHRLVLIDRRNGPIGITNAGLVPIGQMKQLRVLHIEVPVGDRAMGALHNLASLENLYLGEKTKVTEKDYRGLCEALPDCLIQWNGIRHPRVSQIDRIEVSHRTPNERQIVTITDRDQISEIKVWLEAYGARPEHGWKQDDVYGPSGATLSLRFEGKNRLIQEIPFGNGVFHMNLSAYCPMSGSDENDLLGLLGIEREESSSTAPIN